MIGRATMLPISATRDLLRMFCLHQLSSAAFAAIAYGRACLLPREAAR